MMMVAILHQHTSLICNKIKTAKNIIAIRLVLRGIISVPKARSLYPEDKIRVALLMATHCNTFEIVFCPYPRYDSS